MIQIEKFVAIGFFSQFLFSFMIFLLGNENVAANLKGQIWFYFRNIIYEFCDWFGAETI